MVQLVAKENFESWKLFHADRVDDLRWVVESYVRVCNIGFRYEMYVVTTVGTGHAMGADGFEAFTWY